MKRRFTISDMTLISLAGFGIGGLVTLIVNSIQTSKIRGKQKPMKFTCNINATLEPEKSVKVKKSEKLINENNKTDRKGN